MPLYHVPLLDFTDDAGCGTVVLVRYTRHTYVALVVCFSHTHITVCVLLTVTTVLSDCVWLAAADTLFLVFALSPPQDIITINNHKI